MSATAHLYSQFAHPRGPLGRLAGRVMAWENVRANTLVVDQLGVGPEDAVLEIGSGPGVAVAAALERAPRGFVAGVDSSAVMVRQARRRNRRAVEEGRADLVHGRAEALPFSPERFTRVLTVNALRHWQDVGAGIREIHRVLKPGGRVALAFRGQRETRSLDPHSNGAAEEEIEALVELLAGSGFEAVERRQHDLGRETLVTLLARRRA